MRNFIYSLMTDKNQSVFVWPIKFVMYVLSFGYRLIVFLRSVLYDFGFFPRYQASQTVISVGNLVVGGTGKTPVVILLAKTLMNRRGCVAILTRGYMPDDAEASDEAMMLEQALPKALIYANPKRVASIKQANKDHVISTYILDDGFQHWAIERDLDIVILDATNPFGNGQTLPRGILRESKTALRRADIVIFMRADLARQNVSDLRKMCINLNPSVSVFEARHEVSRVTSLFEDNAEKEGAVLKDDVLGVCGIGNPDGFRDTLTQSGASLSDFLAYEDHHVYSLKDVNKIVEHCRSKGVQKIAVTHKDAVKLEKFKEMFLGLMVLVVHIEVKIKNGEEDFISRINLMLRS